MVGISWKTILISKGEFVTNVWKFFPIKQAFLTLSYAYVCLHIRGVRNVIRLHYIYIIMILNALNSFSNVIYNRSIKKLLYNTTRSLLIEIIFYGIIFHSFLLNRFQDSRITKKQEQHQKINKFVFQIYASGQNFMRIRNSYQPFFSCKIAWFYDAKNNLSTKNPIGTIPKQIHIMLTYTILNIT